MLAAAAASTGMMHGAAVVAASYRVTTTAPIILGGTNKQRQLIDAILRDLAGSGVAEARIGLAPRDYRRPGTAWLYFKVHARSGSEYARGSWHADVVRALYAEAIKKGWRRLSGSTVTLIPANGRERFDGSGVILALHPIEDAPEELVLALLRQSAKRSPLTVRSITFDRPLGHLAPKVSAEVETASELRGQWNHVISELTAPLEAPPGGGPALIEGSYIEIRDRADQLLLASGYAARSTSAITWTNRALRAR